MRLTPRLTDRVLLDLGTYLEYCQLLRPPFERCELTIDCHKRPVDLAQTFQAILQCLCNVMSVPQLRVLFHQDVNLDADSVSGVVGLDALEALNKRLEAVRHEHQLALHTTAGSFASQTCDVLETCTRPVVDDEQRENAGAKGVKPPDADLVTDERKKQSLELV